MYSYYYALIGDKYEIMSKKFALKTAFADVALVIVAAAANTEPQRCE